MYMETTMQAFVLKYIPVVKMGQWGPNIPMSWLKNILSLHDQYPGYPWQCLNLPSTPITTTTTIHLPSLIALVIVTFDSMTIFADDETHRSS